MKSHSAIPPRVGTAPMSKTPAPTLADFRSAAHARQTQPSAAPGLPRAPPAGALPGKPPAAVSSNSPKPAAAGAANGHSGPISPEPERAVAATETGADDDSYPEDRMYEISHFIKFKQCQAPVPQLVMEYASRLWKEMPEHLSSLQNNSLRDNLFKEVNATMPSKVLVERKLHNEVLGILGKVTEGNLQRMKQELIDLPIRQSTEEEIREVINTFFRKCTRPEDTRYTPLYVELIHHLISTIGEHEPAGRMIRREVLEQCRDTFVNARDDSKELEDRIANLPPEEADLERMQFAGKQKANVVFLGLLFCASVTHEMVVISVLEHLLYGDGKRRRVVPDFCVVHFMELLQTCGPYLSQHTCDVILPRFVKTVCELRRSHPSKRIQVLIDNFLESMKNNWVPVHGKGAPAGTTQGSHGMGTGPQRLKAVITVIESTTLDSTKRTPDREEFWKVMDDFFTTSEVEEIKALVEQIPVDVLIVYTSKWIGRYISTYKYGQERGRLGELFEQLDSKGAVSAETARTAIQQHVQHAIDEDLFTDQPKYFAHWAAVIKGGRGVFPLKLHTMLLDMLVAAHVSRGVLKKAITDITKVVADNSKSEQKDYQPQDRFRVLQALLRYHPPLLAGDSDDDEEDDDEDIVDYISKLQIDVEVTFFKALCDSYDEGTVHGALQSAAEALKVSHSNAYPLLAAFFTFVRYDTDSLCTTYREVVKKICSVRPLVSLLEEVYVQWTKLECPESHYVGFLKKLMSIVSPSKNDPVEKLKERLRAEYKCEKMILLIEKAFK